MLNWHKPSFKIGHQVQWILFTVYYILCDHSDSFKVKNCQKLCGYISFVIHFYCQWSSVRCRMDNWMLYSCKSSWWFMVPFVVLYVFLLLIKSKDVHLAPGSINEAPRLLCWPLLQQCHPLLLLWLMTYPHELSGQLVRIKCERWPSKRHDASVATPPCRSHACTPDYNIFCVSPILCLPKQEHHAY